MALTGTLLADFSSYTTAVQDAVVKLRDFDSGAAKVSSSLSKMGDSFSGRKVVQDATLMAQIFQDLGGATVFTTSELARMGAVGAEAIEKLRALGKDIPPGIRSMADAATQAEASLKGVGTATVESGGFIETFAGQVTGMAAGFVSAQAIIGLVSTAFHTLTQFVGDSVKSYAAAETGQVRMTAALRQHSLATPEVIEQYNALATAFQRTTANADEEVNTMEALLTQIGGVMPSAMAGALKASTDLAAGLGIDLESATRLVAKAAAGHIETLGKYGITVSAAAYESKGFEAVLEAVNRQFGGQAAAELTTYTGQVKQLGADWDNVKEAIGKFVIMNPVAIAAMREFRQATQEAGDHADKMGVSVTGALMAMGAPTEWVLIAARLEQLALQANDSANALARLESAPSWFKTLAAGGGALPAITEGMKLFNAEVKYDEEVAKAAAAAAKQFDAAWAELSVTGATAKDTLAAINPETLKTINYYLEAGASVHTLAAAFPEAGDAGVAAAKKIKDATAAAVAESAIGWSQYFRDVAGMTGSSVDKSKAATQAWLDDQIAKHVLAKTDTADFYNWAYATAALMNAKNAQLTLESDAYSKDHYAKLATDAKAAYDFALRHAASYTEQEIRLLGDAALEAERKSNHWAQTAADDMDKVKGKTKETAGEFGASWGRGFLEVEAGTITWRTAMSMASASIDADLTKNIKNVQTLAGEFLSAAEAKRLFDSGGSAAIPDLTQDTVDRMGGRAVIEQMVALGRPTNPGTFTAEGIADLARRQASYDAMVAYLSRVPAAADGLTNFGGGMALVGERGPELVNLPSGSDVFPTGTGPSGGITYAAGAIVIHVNGTAEEVARKVADQIMRTAKMSRQFGSAS